MGDELDRLLRDHRHVEVLLTQLQEQAETAPMRVLDAAEALVSRHLATALEALYPAAHRALDDGDEQAKAARLGVEEIQLTMQRIRHTPMGVDEFRAELGRYVASVRQQLRNERATIERLRSTLDPDALARVDAHLQRAARHATSRPHPHMPKSAAGMAVGNLVMGAADRIRDRLRA